MRSLRTVVSTSIALAFAAAPGLAAASPSYPGLITTDLSLDYTLGTTDCILCHATNTGGVGTVVQPFGKAMKAAGLTLENPPALATALMKLAADKTDSDCNGIPDIQQLEDGQDPNNGVYLNGDTATPPANPGCATTATTELPAFGCGARIAPARLSWQGAAALAAALGLALARRRR